MMNIGSAEHLYMMESEGMEGQVTTRRAKILAAADEVRDNQLDMIDDIYAVVADHGLDLCDFTPAELDEFTRRAGLN